MTTAEPMVAKTTTSVSVSVSVRGNTKDALDLEPIHTTTLLAEEAPTLRGVPRMPLLWVRGTPRLSGDGDRVNVTDPTPDEIVTTADSRFVALPEYWDPETMVWLPSQTTLNYWVIRGTTLPTRPLLDEYEVMTKNGILLRQAFDLSNGAHLVSDFARDRVLSQTISMVIWPMENETPIMDWLNVEDLSHQPNRLERTGIWRTDKYDFYWSGTGSSVDPVVPLAKHSPVYLTMVIDPPEVRLYVSLSGKHNFFQTKATAENNDTTPLLLGFGKTALSQTQGNYRLFEVNFWDDALSSEQVLAHHALMMSTYGVHYEWG